MQLGWHVHPVLLGQPAAPLLSAGGETTLRSAAADAGTLGDVDPVGGGLARLLDDNKRCRLKALVRGFPLTTPLKKPFYKVWIKNIYGLRCIMLGR